MDYSPFVAFHRQRRADVTIAVRRVPLAEASRMGILAMDETGRITEFQEKPKQPKSDLASMGVYVFSKRAFHRWLDADHPDFGGDVIPAMLDGGARVYGYRFDGYWQDVGTIHSYWEANMALLEDRPQLDLYDKEWLIHTRSEERAPAKIGATAQVHRSLISHGCQVEGMVVNSVLSPGVVVGVGAVVRDSILMFDTVVRPGAVIDRAILDKEVTVGPGAIVGEGADLDGREPPHAQPPQHGDHDRRQAGGAPARHPDRPQRADRPRRAGHGLHGPDRGVRGDRDAARRPAEGGRARRPSRPTIRPRRRPAVRPRAPRLHRRPAATTGDPGDPDARRRRGLAGRAGPRARRAPRARQRSPRGISASTGAAASTSA